MSCAVAATDRTTTRMAGVTRLMQFPNAPAQHPEWSDGSERTSVMLGLPNGRMRDAYSSRGSAYGIPCKPGIDLPCCEMKECPAQ